MNFQLAQQIYDNQEPPTEPDLDFDDYAEELFYRLVDIIKRNKEIIIEALNQYKIDENIQKGDRIVMLFFNETETEYKTLYNFGELTYYYNLFYLLNNKDKYIDYLADCLCEYETPDYLYSEIMKEMEEDIIKPYLGHTKTKDDKYIRE